MTDKELADRVVALGVGRHCKGPIGAGYGYEIDNSYLLVFEFTSDWRVAGALMEKIAAGRFRSLDMGLISKGSDKYEVWGFEIDIDCSHYEKFSSMNESLPRAIIEACVEALE